MNLDEQLRAVLSQEADMRSVPQPDVDRFISGGRARRRRRNMARVGALAAAVVLICGAAYGVTQIDSGTPGSDPGFATSPSESADSETTPPTYEGGEEVVEPGTYRMPVGFDSTGAALGADLTFEDSSWEDRHIPLTFDETTATWAGVVAYQPSELPGRSACALDGRWIQPGRQAAETPKDLAQQFTRLPRSTVLQPPTPSQAFGHDALHLRLRIDDKCPLGQAYKPVNTPDGGHGISYSDVPKEVFLDLWVVDLNGSAVVVERLHQAGAPKALVNRATRVVDSITFVTGE